MRDQMKELHRQRRRRARSPLFIEAAADYFKGPKTPAVKAAVAADKKPNKGAEPSSNRGT